jgi:hypothetical protein
MTIYPKPKQRFVDSQTAVFRTVRDRRIVKIVPGIGDGGSVEKVANPELEEETEFLGDGQYEFIYSSFRMRSAMIRHECCKQLCVYKPRTDESEHNVC